MAVEKVTMINIVGQLKDVNNFARDIYLFNDLELLNAMTEVEAGRYTLPVSEKNINELLEFSHIKEFPYRQPHQKECQKFLEIIEKFYGNQLKYDPAVIKNVDIDPEKIFEGSRDVLNELSEKFDQLEFNLEKLHETQQSLTAYSYLKDIDVSMRELNDLKNFSYSIGSFTTDNAVRLKVIYPSIPAVLFHIGDTENNEQVYFIICPNDFKTETDRVLKALDFKPIEGYDRAYQGTPEQIIKMLKDKERSLQSEIEVLEALKNGVLKKSYDQINLLYNELLMLLTVDTVKTYMAYSESNFYFSAWIPIRLKDQFNALIEKYPDLIVLYETPNSTVTPPTKLRNNWLFRPFEELVKMYGTPNYHELDPTPFLSLTYILFFGYMFGDVGQGLILLLGGYIAEKKGFSLGGIASRIAVASIFFGFMYGSVFGVETIIPALWLRPMEDTTTLLITAIAIGVVMLIIAYIYSFINKHREHEIEQEYFGKNGYSGFLIYIGILTIVLMMYNYLPNDMVVRDVIIALIVIFTILVFLALPLTNLLEHRKFSYDVKGDYYVSSFFEVFEMYLSMLSNTLSFIRVGAFALTHVGMFMAFDTLADMTGGGIAGIIVLVIGNVFIIIMEGLIDVIQCLRLEFYELFGKYYQGNGIEFISVQQTVKNINQNN